MKVRRWRPAAFVIALVVSALALPGLAPASPYVHAHRGGPLATEVGIQVARYPEDTMPAFEAAAAAGFVLELDVKLTRDRVPVVIHDATLDRTTDCAGLVANRTAAGIASRCEVDMIGTDGTAVALPPGDPRRTRIPTLRQVLDLANESGATINLEIKNVPTDADFEIGEGFAKRVIRELVAARFPPSRLIVQSFWPLNLDVVERELPGADTSLLTLAQMDEGGPAFADARGYEWVSPAWPVSAAYIAEAHALGLQVVPYTLDSAPAIRNATIRGVDAIISNDPQLAREVVARNSPEPPPIPPPPGAAACDRVRAKRSLPPIEAYDPQPGAPRVFAMQFKQELRNITTYERFRAKIECMILEYVVPRLASDRPNVVAFNEDIGLMTLATGTRGAPARAIFANPDLAPSCESGPAPCGVVAAIAAVRAGYTRELAAYTARFPTMPPVGAMFVAGTDTFARGWMQVFSDMAHRYGVYILGSNNQPSFRESVDPSEIATFADPDLVAGEGLPESVYVATEGNAYNRVLMWGPENVRREGPPMLRNVVAQNDKVPLTAIEEVIQVQPGPATGPDAIENVRPYHLPGTDARISFATSLPAFVYGGEPVTGFGEPLPPGVDPCSDTSKYYMRCLDKLGANLVMQDEANPGRWGTYQAGGWQPLEWMSSTWRAVADPTVSFEYNVTPHMVGNLADLPFDGQTAITQRGLATGPGCHYVGNGALHPRDSADYDVYAGPKTEFIAIAPWVIDDASRSRLRSVGDRLAPGSGDPLENDYVETAIVADLPFPVDPARPSCVG